jgi:hypothetical protein
MAFSHYIPLALALAFAVPGMGIALASVVRGLGNVSNAAGTFAEASANVSTAFAAVAVATSKGTVGLVDEVWQGVDLLNLAVTAQREQLEVDDPRQLEDYIRSNAGRTVWKAPEFVTTLVLATTREAAAGFEMQSLSESWLDVNSRYRQLHLQMHYNSVSDMWEVEWLFVDVSFEARWANPAWELLRLSPNSEEEHIRFRLNYIVT